jgi:hypothetical protein
MMPPRGANAPEQDVLVAAFGIVADRFGIGWMVAVATD